MEKIKEAEMKEPLQGGLLNVLSEDDVHRIHEASLQLLANPGMKTSSPLIADIFARGGAQVDVDSGVIQIPPDLVHDALEHAPKSFVLHGQQTERDLLLEQPCIYFGQGGTPVPYVWDADRRVPREPNIADIVAATKVGEALKNVDFVMLLGSAAEVPAESHYLHEYAALLNNTTKPLVCSAPSRRYAQYLLEMCAAVAGGESALTNAPFVVLIAQTRSPLELGDYFEGVVEFASLGIPVLSSPGPMMGATSPATLAGNLVLGNAEALAGIVLCQLCRQGAPVVYAPHTTVMDMHTARCTYAGTEQTLARAGVAQLARFYGLPSFGIGAGTDSKVPDAQAAAEAMIGLLMNALSGLTLNQSMGTMAGGTYGSLEMLVISDEIAAMVKRILRGITVSEQTLAVEEIRDVGWGGHFLDRAHTLKMFRSEFFFPALFDRRSVWDWLNDGARDAQALAHEKVLEILHTEVPSPLCPAKCEEVGHVLIRSERELIGG